MGHLLWKEQSVWKWLGILRIQQLFVRELHGNCSHTDPWSASTNLGER